ncbi:hypothetical protein GCM10020255_031460 [Rhodococcus baikonurensis]
MSKAPTSPRLTPLTVPTGTVSTEFSGHRPPKVSDISQCHCCTDSSRLAGVADTADTAGYLIEDPCCVNGMTSMVMYGNKGDSENLVQFVRRVDVEDADVAELSHYSPQMHPLALALKVL